MPSFLDQFPHPEFIDRDPEKITSETIAQAEQLLERKLYPAQVERLLINLLAFREMHVRMGVQHAAEQNLVRFATGNNLDYLGELVGAYRLADSPATCTVRFTLEEPQRFDVTIAPGALLSSAGSDEILWETYEPRIIYGTQSSGISPRDEDGCPYVDVPVRATINGVIGNGFLPGEINQLLKSIPNIKSVANVDQTRQGLPVEDDDRFRRRIQLAPERFVGSSVEGYQFLALSVAQSIVDVSVTQPTPGRVMVHVLTNEGVPSALLINEVSKALSPERDRALTDWVTVAAPQQVDYTISLKLWLFKGSIQSQVTAEVQQQLERYRDDRKLKLGQDLVPSQIAAIAGTVRGVYRVEVVSPTYRKLQPGEWGNITGIQLQVMGEEDG